VSGALEGLARRDDVEVSAYALTWRGRRDLAPRLPAGVRAATRPMAARLLRALWRRGDRPPIEWWTGPLDVAHGTNFIGPPARRAATVVTIHDLTPVRYPEMSTPDTRQYPGLLRRALARGAWVHTPSAAMAAEVVELLGADPDRVVPVHHGVPPVRGGDPVAGRRLAGAERYVLALGTIEPRKNLPTLVAAFDVAAASLPDLRLVVAGPDGWGRDAYDAAVGRMAHRDRVVRLGWVEDPDRAALLSGAWAFAYPSLYEGFGFPPLEAMAVGVPVVASTAGALQEVLDGAAHLVDPTDVDGLAAALVDLDDDTARAALVERGRARVGAFSWDACAEGLCALYSRAAGD
jgi:glycosyltransferase involved in cell wall biosynthesis